MDWESTNARWWYACIPFAERTMINSLIPTVDPPLPWVSAVVWDTTAAILGIPAGSPRYDALYSVLQFVEAEIPDGSGGLLEIYIPDQIFLEDVHLFRWSAPPYALEYCMVKDYLDDRLRGKAG